MAGVLPLILCTLIGLTGVRERARELAYVHSHIGFIPYLQITVRCEREIFNPIKFNPCCQVRFTRAASPDVRAAMPIL